MTPDLPALQALLPDAGLIGQALAAAGWSATALDELLGATARTHLDRDELAPLLRRTADGGDLSTLARLFVLGVPVDATEASRAGVPSGWLHPDGTAAVRLQAVSMGGSDVTVAHDPGRAATGVHPDQVLGVGAASLTLAAATPRRAVGRTLDLGTGSGIQALLAAGHSEQVLGTDRNPRAVAYTRLSAAVSGVPLDVLAGDLLTPVHGQRFDLAVSNPPFVVGPAARYTYRDAGLEGDDVCRRLIGRLPDVLSPDGIAVLLANWLHVEGEDGDARIAAWVPPGCDGWVVQRELAAPADYVTAWLRDTDENERFDPLFEQWVAAFEQARVEAIAFGVVALRRTDGPGSVVLDVVDQPVAAEWGHEVVDHFARRDALATGILDRAWRLRSDVRMHQAASRGFDGWVVQTQLLQQFEGLRWSGGIDEYGAALLAGCDGRTPLRTLFALLAASAGLDEQAAIEQGLPAVQRLVEQGFLVP